MAKNAEEILAEIRRRAAEGDQRCIDWLEHQEAKGELRAMAKSITRSERADRN